jgi:Collagen triple helix repeat (20 copies)
MRRSRTTVLIAAGTLLVGAVGAQVASASIPDSATKVFHGCVNKATGVVRLVDPTLSGDLGNCITRTGVLAETAVTWNATGSQGPAGPVGPVGLTGAAGADGKDGSVGPTGPAGAIGPVGLTGAAGADGNDGSVGPTGPAGAIGPVGLTGAAGADGKDGSVGPAGPAGAVGPAGPAGPAGPGSTLYYTTALPNGNTFGSISGVTAPVVTSLTVATGKPYLVSLTITVTLTSNQTTATCLLRNGFAPFGAPIQIAAGNGLPQTFQITAIDPADIAGVINVVCTASPQAQGTVQSVQFLASQYNQIITTP